MQPAKEAKSSPECINSGEVKNISEERKKELLQRYGKFFKKVGVSPQW